MVKRGFDFKKRWKLYLAILLILIVVVAVSFVVFNYVKTIGQNGKNETRFVDKIDKITVEINKQRIQAQLDNLSYAGLSLEIDDMKNIDSVLSSISKEDFILEYRGQTWPLIEGNATKRGISQLNANPHVLKIYYNPPGGSVLFQQDSVPYIDPEIYAEFDKGNEWVRVIVTLSSSEILDSVIDSMPTDDFRLMRKIPEGTVFSGYLRKKAFTVLINNSYLLEVRSEKPIHAA